MLNIYLHILLLQNLLVLCLRGCIVLLFRTHNLFLLIVWFLEYSICLSNSFGLIIHDFFCNGLIIQCLDKIKKSFLKVICPLSFNRNDSPNIA